MALASARLTTGRTSSFPHPREGGRDSTGASSQEFHVASQARPMENNESKKLFPLSELALLTFLKAVSDASVTGVTLLNVYSSTCVLAWAENPVNIILKAALVGLPLSILPILLITRSILKVAEQGGCSLDIGAVLVLSQLIYINVLGGVIVTVMFQVSKIIVASITAVLICIVIKMWGCVSSHPKCLMVVNSDRIDLKNCFGIVSGQSITKVAEGKLEMAQNHSVRTNSIRKSLNICFMLYFVFYIGFMLVLAIVAEKWWHALLGVAVMSPIHISGLYLTSYLRDGLIRVHTMGLPNSDDDLGCKLLSSGNM
ncbi:unnamed protein product [Alopecurus aequalis]